MSEADERKAQVTVKTYQNYVNGQWVGSSSMRPFPFTIPRPRK